VRNRGVLFQGFAVGQPTAGTTRGRVTAAFHTLPVLGVGCARWLVLPTWPPTDSGCPGAHVGLGTKTSPAVPAARGAFARSCVRNGHRGGATVGFARFGGGGKARCARNAWGRYTVACRCAPPATVRPPLQAGIRRPKRHVFSPQLQCANRDTSGTSLNAVTYKSLKLHHVIKLADL